MRQPDDYDIFEEEARPPRRTFTTATWISLLVAVGLVAFSVGLAIGTFANRLGGAVPPPNPTVALPAATVVAVADTPTVPITATVGAPEETPSPTPTETETPTPSPTASCPQPVATELAGAYDPAALGCATAGAGIYWSAWETFERGAMFWRSDNNQAYAFFDDGAWSHIQQGWEGQEIPYRGEPPPGLQAPIRGFGYAWATRDDLFQRLGWARSEERGFCALIQPFERGFLIQSSTVEYCQDNLYNTAREPGWGPIELVVLNTGQWRPFGQPFGGALPDTALPPAAAPTAVVMRPEANGRFVAQRATPRLDADFGDWPGNWSPVAHVVQGAENYSGPQDLSGAFQVAWSNEGLYFAVRVTDDRYRSGPAGTDQWQGDGIEIHFDRHLAADFDNPQANGDDYQVGIAFGPGRNELRGYRWLPPVQEGFFTPVGAVTAVGEGYHAEFLLPWRIFEVTERDLELRVFGFMFSLNDNDLDTPAQQTVLSTSANRTTYNRPDEWGTLILAN
jgi:hypothetical protein